MTLAVVRDLREARGPVGPEELAGFETDVLAGFVLARAAAGLSDGTISSDVVHLEQVRAWFGRPLWEMEPADADVYFGKVLRGAARGTRLSRAQALKTYFVFLELRHKAEIHQVTGRVAECPIDEVNRPRGRQQARLRIPPTAEQAGRLFAGWRGELATCRKFAPAARNYAGGRRRPAGQRGPYAGPGRRAVGAGPVRQAQRPAWQGIAPQGPKPRLVPLISGADRNLRWFIVDVWGQFGAAPVRPGVPLLPSERKNADGSAARVGDETLRAALAAAATAHLPDWPEVVTPHVLRHFCASQLYLAGMELLAIQATLGHAWVATTMGYVHELSGIASDGRRLPGSVAMQAA